ncbi:MAG: hypothetical protein AABY26_04590 [Nanoarchaeota archaeon]
MTEENEDRPIRINLEGRVIFQENKPEPKAAPIPAKDKEEPVQKNYFVRHPYWSAAAAIVIPGIGVTLATSKPDPTLVKGIVLEEKYVSSDTYALEKNIISADKTTEEKTKKPQSYLLHVKVYEPTEEGTTERLCTFYIKEDDRMPVAVLDEVISAGSTVYLHYYDSGITLHSAESLYQISCFGMLLSTEIKGVHSWESSEVVKKSLEDHLEEVRVQELKRAKEEVNDVYERILF